MDINATFVDAGYRILNDAEVDERATYEIDGATVVMVRIGTVVWIASPMGVERHEQECGHEDCAREFLWAGLNAAAAKAEAEARAENPLHRDLDELILTNPITAAMVI